MNITIKSTTQGSENNWYQYIWVLTGWETDHGSLYTEVHFTMPKSFFSAKSADYSEMATCPHITLKNSKGWVFHRYENSKKKYPESNRLVKFGSAARSGSVYPANSAENLIVAAAVNLVVTRQGR